MKEDDVSVYENGVRRLLSLPPVFSLEDLEKDGIFSDYARVMVSRWKKSGFINPVGKRCGIYYNNIANNDVSEQWKTGEAIKKVFGEDVVIIGASILYDHFWTVQIPHALTIAVPESRTYKNMNNVVTFSRPQEWFEYIGNTNNKMDSLYNLNSLSPGMALADGIHHGDSLGRLSPDDLEYPDNTDYQDILNAFQTIGVPEDKYQEWINENESLIMK